MILQQNLLDEAFKWCLHDDNILSVVCSNLSSEDIPKDLKSYDVVLAILKQNNHSGDSKLTLGELQQKFYRRGFDDDKIFERIRSATLSTQESLLSQLTSHIKGVKSIQAYEDFGEAYQKSDKDKAVSDFVNNVKEVELIDFSLNTIVSHNPFTNITDVLLENEVENEIRGNSGKMPFSIPPLDKITGGGSDVGETALFILPSGGGKSTILKTISSNAIRLGFKGIHYQLEGSRKEAILKYGNIITGVSYNDQLRGYIPSKVKPRWILLDGKKVLINDRSDILHLNESKIKYMLNRVGSYDLSVNAYDNLGDATLTGIEADIKDWVEVHGCNPDFIIVDSLDLAHPGDGVKYSPDPTGVKARIQACTKKLKNMATDFETRVITATQTSDIPMEKWNDPNFVITRNHSMGDKNIANPFSYVFSGNRTMVEKKSGMARIYIDKLRHSGVPNPIVFVKTDFNNGKYVDVKGTLEGKVARLNDPDFIPKKDEEPKKD